jgi:hypothetical protein
MKEACHGYYIDLGEYISEPILHANPSNFLHKFEFIVHRVTEGIPDTPKPGMPYNIRHIFTILSPTLSRKHFEKNGWKLSAQFRTHSQFTPKSVSISAIDINGAKQEFSVKGATHEAIIDILKKLDDLAKYYDWSHYNLKTENEKLQREVAALKKQVEELGG